MYFTQEDYRKIEKWLLSNSRKDTDFVGAATPLKGNETVVLVQNGKNVKTSVKDVVEQLFLLGVSDFVNITDKYGESYISLSQAIELIPYRSRKVGQVITFLDETGKWSMYQFQGLRKNQWNTLSLWVDLIDLMKGMTVVDSEDIVTEVNSANQTSLKFADKTYNEADYSGLGRIYLRKNVINVEDPVTGNIVKMNYLTQSMISKENTIYIIQYDYSLNGQTIIIPDNCVLWFNGGSLKNGIINCNNTCISPSGESSIFDNITVEGSINSDLFLSFWKITSKQDIAPIVENGLYVLTRNKHKFVIDIDCYISSYASVPSNSDLYINKDVTITSSGNGGFTVMNRNTSVYRYNGASNVTIHGEGIFDFNSRTYNSPTNSAIQLYHCSNITIEGLTFKDPASYHVIEIGSSINVNIRNCKFYGFRPIATSALPELSIKGECIQIEHSKAGNAGIEVPYFDNVECRDINISNNLFDGLYEYDEEGNKIYDTYMWRPIGCHEDHTGGDVGNTYHEGLVVSNNIFNSVKQVCITPRYINNCEIINNIANDLYGIFVSGLPVGKNFYNVSFDFNNAKIVGNVIKFNKDMTSNTLVSSIWIVGRNNWGAISLMGCAGTVISGNEIYNAPNSCIILNCSPNTLIEGNKFCEWNTIDKNKGASSSNRAAVDIMDDTPSEDNNQVKEVTTNVSMSGNLFFDTWESFPIRPFTRNKADIEESWNIIDNVFNIKNPAWRFIPPTTVNALDLSSFGSALVNGHPVWNTGFKGKSFTIDDDGRNIYFNGSTWLNEDGTLFGKVLIV